MNSLYKLLPIGIVLLLIIQIVQAVNLNTQAEIFVSRIHGTQQGPVVFYEDVEKEVHGTFLVYYDYTKKLPPSCDVTINSELINKGLNIYEIDLGPRIDAQQFKSIHNVKNGHTSTESIYDIDIITLMKEHPGEWYYVLEFTFHCSLIDNEWFNSIIPSLDKTFKTRPIKLIVGDDYGN